MRALIFALAVLCGCDVLESSDEDRDREEAPAPSMEAVGGSGAAAGPPAMADEAPVPAPTPKMPMPKAQPIKLLENGGICRVSDDCSSNLCGRQTNSGELRCYGNKRANEDCGDTYDCRGGVCIPRAPGSTDAVCVTGVEVCLDNGLPLPCVEVAAESCQQFRSMCPGDDLQSMSDFDGCVRLACDALLDVPDLNCDRVLRSIRIQPLECPGK